MFLIIPTSYLAVGSFQDKAGNFTIQNYADLTKPIIVNAYSASLEISLVTAILGADLRLPARLRRDLRRAADRRSGP